ncbi:hypothetical protein [Pseudolysinimonas sp.]|uniref:hypothetical protein n=1 Tax=Pseudolysinimonas sp. TaxID=2680009 RepID=UPI0037841061
MDRSIAPVVRADGTASRRPMGDRLAVGITIVLAAAAVGIGAGLHAQATPPAVQADKRAPLTVVDRPDEVVDPWLALWLVPMAAALLGCAEVARRVRQVPAADPSH